LDFPPSETPNEIPALETPRSGEDVSWQRMFLDILETVILAVVLFLGINAVSARVRVDGFSMIPTLQDGEFMLVNRMAYRVGEPDRGDIIVFRSITEPGKELVKRIIGLPGDRVEVRDGEVWVNGQALDEPYIAAAPRYTGMWEVPEGSLFVLGDNRNDSSDSHQWGMLPVKNIIGKAILIYWPLPQLNFIRHIDLLAAS